MDFVWTPWRYRYISAVRHDDRCVFCDAVAAEDDAHVLILHRGAKNFIILNRYPYTPGHVMVVPYAHVATLEGCDAETLNEMMALAKRMQEAIGVIYHPEGYNLGLNIGRAAGAGITNHIHMHVLPRWTGDTNFMTTIAETRLEPEELEETYRKLHAALGLEAPPAAAGTPAGPVVKPA